MIQPMRWEDGALQLLDQRLLPHEETWLTLRTVEEVAAAIRDMAVRGAPAIGIAAAYGMALAVADKSYRTYPTYWTYSSELVAASRPTAVNLFWVLARLEKLEDRSVEAVLAEAQAIEAEDLAMNHAIGRNGANLFKNGWNILTICNTGAIATAGHGTALGVIRTAHADGKAIHVYTCETRPRMQGLLLTAWELQKEGIPFHSIADSAAASLMRAGRVDAVIAGADRITANGDTANKIGTYSLAVLARHHGIPFYIAAPSSTFDPAMASGDQIPIEHRVAEELTEIRGVRVAPVGIPVENPAFDVTPGELIDAIITEHGVFTAPYLFQVQG